MPFGYRPQTLVGQSIGPDAVDVALVVVTLVLAAGAVLVARPRLRRPQAPEVLLIAFLFFALASSLWSAQPVATVGRVGFLVVALIPLWLLTGYYSAMEEFLEHFLWSCLAILVLFGLQWSFFRAEVVSADYASGVPRVRAVVPTIGSNPLALIAALVVLASLVGVARWVRTSIVATTLIVALAMAVLLLTRTRTSLVLLVASLLVVAALTFFRSRLLSGLFPLIVAGIAILAVSMPQVVLDAVLRGQSDQEFANLTGRLSTWAIAHDSWSDSSALLGGGYFAAHRQVAESSAGLTVRSNLDNTWLEVLVDLGIIGFLLLGAFFLSASLRVLRQPVNRSWRLFIVTWVIWLAVVSLVNPTIQSHGPNFYVGMVLLLAPMAVTQEPRPRIGRTSSSGTQ